VEEFKTAQQLEEYYRQQAKTIVRERLERANNFSEQDLYQSNLSLPPEFKYQSIREMQTVLVKGAFDALGFSVELGLLDKKEATDYWQLLHKEFAHLWAK
jgi:uncharacterized protein YlaN (UPF0358 family)